MCFTVCADIFFSEYGTKGLNMKTLWSFSWHEHEESLAWLATCSHLTRPRCYGKRGEDDSLAHEHGCWKYSHLGMGRALLVYRNSFCSSWSWNKIYKIQIFLSFWRGSESRSYGRSEKGSWGIPVSRQLQGILIHTDAGKELAWDGLSVLI